MSEQNSGSSLISKLRKKLDRMLGRKDKEHLDISYKPKQDTPTARKSYRIDVDNMHLICRTPRIKCRISDISATGIGFISSKKFPVGETVETVIFWSGKPVLKGLKMKIMRQQDKIIGCEFQNLERGQDKIISKIVLAAQKRLIEKKHSGKTPDTVSKEVRNEAERTMKRGTPKKTSDKIKL